MVQPAIGTPTCCWICWISVGSPNPTSGGDPGPQETNTVSNSVAQVAGVGLADEVDTEAVVRLLGHQGEAACQVDRPGGGQRMVGPQPDPAVPGRAGEVE